jgi:hypothetical protein
MSRMIGFGTVKAEDREEEEPDEPHPRRQGGHRAPPSSGVTGSRLKRFRKNPM